MQQYFDAQMRLLTQAGKQFAENYPEHAGLLNIDSIKERDPHVERLLEGVAYLNANIHKRLDESLPEVSEQVLRQLCPALLNFYPSTTVFQFTPKFSMQESLVVEKGLEITTAQAVENVKCKFTTCHDVKMLPLEIVNVECHDTFEGSELFIKFKWICQGEKENYDLEKLRVYLDGDTPLVSSLYQLLMSTNEPLTVDFGHTNASFNKQLSHASVQPAFIDQRSALLPNASTSHPGYALLHDYFNGRERFNFLDIFLGDQFNLPERFDDFVLHVKSSVKLPPGHKLGAANIKLNCVVGINLFSQDAEPIRLELNRTDYPVIPDQSKRHYVHTYSVDKVQGRDKLTAEESDYTPRYQSVFGDEQRLYTLNLRDIGAAVPSHYINLPVQHSGIDDTVSAKLTCYNGRWPKQTIREGQLSVGGKDMPQLLQVRNVARPSNYKTSHESAQHWQLISLLNLKFSSLASVTELKQLLALFDWSGRGENKRRIESITAVQSKKFNQVKRGIFIQGSELCITLDETKFSCQADVYHFATMLHQFFIMYAPINQSIQTRIECTPSYQEFVWTITPGQSAHI
ncbi:type VI secretion system baseplate subunit TssF [Thalassotalea euphylliae]|uniref:Type VI secretion system baseplate subunit TssF n=1 Tax=Thalassotalea euphylliae TaxID=1655234 RepID=A0A3E0TQC1_9GAMM|nr:type VI secretion system baseplate subunit TssF [Thalassotalea euphylliae]REL26643.1 type VI secretion system baseplate subunit TssF [Thalassotalea euphylliae]